MKQAALVILGLLFASAWEILISPIITMSDIRPDVGMIIVVYLALHKGRYAALVFGFLWGMVVDSVMPGSLGWSSCLYVVIGYTIFYLKMHFHSRALPVQLLLLFAAVFVHKTLYFLIFNFSEPGSVFFYMIRFGLTSAVYSVIIGGLPQFWAGIRPVRDVV